MIRPRVSNARRALRRRSTRARTLARTVHRGVRRRRLVAEYVSEFVSEFVVEVDPNRALEIDEDARVALDEVLRPSRGERRV